MWLENNGASNRFTCCKCQMRIFQNYNVFTSQEKHCADMAKEKQLTVSGKDDKIVLYFTSTQSLKYLTYTKQMDKFKSTEF
jgi:hypothetical protein